MCRVERRRDRRSIWASRLKLARGFNVAAVALANKKARIIWALLAQGVHPRAIMELLGHSSITLTMNVYGHVMPAMMRDAADKMDAILGS